MNKRLVVAAAVVIAVAGFGLYTRGKPGPHDLSSDEVAEMKDRFVKFDDLAAAKKKKWTEGTSRAQIDRLEPTEEHCQSIPPEMSDEEAQTYVRDNLAVFAFGWRFALVRKEGESPGEPWFTTSNKILEPIRQRLSAGHPTQEDLGVVRSYTDPEKLNAYRALIVITKSETPFVVRLEANPPSYSPGKLVARVYLYSYAAERITCMANDVVAENSPTIDIRYFARADADMPARVKATRGALGRDLEVSLDRAAREKLVEVK